MQKIANLNQLQEGALLSVPSPIGPVCLTLCNGNVMAFEDRCSHDDGPLSGGKIEKCEVICPRHSARFNMETGDVISPPATGPIEIFRVEVRENDIYIEL